MESLKKLLQSYCNSDAYPLHMPGHKRRLGNLPEPFGIDITEIDGFDNLHHAEGILASAQKRAAQLYGAQETFYLVNGSTGGILSAVSACVPERGTILMARNCHKAAYHAAELRGLHTVYLYPDKVPGTLSFLNGPIAPAQVEELLGAHPEIGAVLITSPTYDGVLSDIRAIAQIAHAHNVPLIVDEAHGAHFGFHPYFPDNALKKGADIVIHSLHKTLPSLTQTALLHVQGDLVNRNLLRRYLGMYQTSSPSYVFMAGMDECLALIKRDGTQLFEAFAGRLERFYQETRSLKHMQVPDMRRGHLADCDTDPSKILITGAISGIEIARVLRERFHIEVEMAEGAYALALMSIADDDEGFERLREALYQIDRELSDSEVLCLPKSAQGQTGTQKEELQQTEPQQTESQQTERAQTKAQQTERPQIQAQQYCTIAQAAGRLHSTGSAAAHSENDEILQLFLADSIGRVSLEYAYIYPPGIPLLVPGEIISEEVIRALTHYRAAGHSIQGMQDYSGETLLCFG